MNDISEYIKNSRMARDFLADARAKALDGKDHLALVSLINGIESWVKATNNQIRKISGRKKKIF